MNEEARRPFRLHLPGLLKVLAEHLYSNRQVGVRELIQNAHDSCLRRAIKSGDPDYRPRIDISVDQPRQVLTIRDNGSGLTAEEIDEYLATIGRSYTRELREDLGMMSRAEAEQLIGQFGFGFLSAFLLANEVTLTTRSFAEGAPALCWRSSGDEYYETTPGCREQPGTTIELAVKPAAAFVLQRQLLIETVQKYADFLPIPIHMDNDPQPLNLMRPPWEADDPQAATMQYIDRAFKLSDPLCVIPLRERVVDLGHDSVRTPLQGFLFVPPQSVASIYEYGDVSVYIRGMFITDGERDLLPPWARFVRGVVECPVLQPTASREAIHQDDAYLAIQQALEEQLGDALRHLALEQPATWRKIVRGHTDVIMGWAVRDNEFFEQVADIVTFRTSRGQLNLPEYLQLTGGTLYYVTKELGSLQEQLLAEGHDVPVIDASQFVTAPFLEKYAAGRPGVGLARLDTEQSHLLRSVPEEPFEIVLAHYRERGIRAEIAAFRPPEVPALMMYPQDADFLLEARRAMQAEELPGPIAGLVGEYIDGQVESEDELRGTLYVNASCPLIQKLAQSPPTDRRAAALTLIFQVARLFSGRTLDAAAATAAFGETTDALGELLG